MWANYLWFSCLRVLLVGIFETTLFVSSTALLVPCSLLDFGQSVFSSRSLFLHLLDYQSVYCHDINLRSGTAFLLSADYIDFKHGNLSNVTPNTLPSVVLQLCLLVLESFLLSALSEAQRPITLLKIADVRCEWGTVSSYFHCLRFLESQQAIRDVWRNLVAVNGPTTYLPIGFLHRKDAQITLTSS